MTTSNTVKLKKYQDINIERLAGGIITPGMLLKLGTANTVIAHNVAAGVSLPKLFALEDELQGKTIADTYASGQPVQIWVAQPGEEVNVILADNIDIDIGDYLVSNGDGTLKKYDADSGDEYLPGMIVAMALEAVDTTGSPASTTARLHVMVV